MRTALLHATIDTWVDQASPSKSHGVLPKLDVSASSGAQRIAYIGGDIAPPIKAGAVVAEASLILVPRGPNWGGAHTITVDRITERWAGPVQWAGRPAAGGVEATLGVTAPAAGTPISIPTTAIAQAAVNGAAFYGYRVRISTNNPKSFFSRDSGTPENFPMLYFAWLEPLDAPSMLSPDGERGVSAAEPMLSWFAVDQAAAQVQVYSAEAMESGDLEWDSGWVTTSINQMLSGYSMATDEQVWWRVRTKSEGGIESAWSDPATFFRRAKGVITIVSPPEAVGEDPVGYVEEFTPPIVHTFDGTQTAVERVIEAYRLPKRTRFPGVGNGVIVGELDPAIADGPAIGWQQIHATGRIDTDELAYSLPEGVLRKEGERYRAIVRVWDDTDREAAPGDPPYVEAVREFEVLRQAGIDPPTSVTATAEEDSPAIRIDVEASASPWGFGVFLDGVLVGEVDAQDAQIDEGVYRFWTWSARPGHVHEVEVSRIEPIEGVRKHSRNNPTDTVTVSTSRKWIVAPAWGIAVPLMNAKVGTAKIGMRIEVADLDGRRDPTTARWRTSGINGVLEGEIWGDTDEDTRDMRDDFLALYSLPETAVIRVIYGDHNFPVALTGEPDYTQSPPGEAWDVRIPYAQVGEFGFEAP